MDILFIAALLFLISAGVHLTIPVIYGKRPTTVPVLIFGSLYLIIGILMFMKFAWLPLAALIVTVVGLIGATATLKSVPEQRTVTLCMNALDVIIIGLLGLALMG